MKSDNRGSTYIRGVGRVTAWTSGESRVVTCLFWKIRWLAAMINMLNKCYDKLKKNYTFTLL